MRLQDSKANCGPTALANALEALGHRRSVAELEVLCRTSATDGTSPRNLVRAVGQLKESCDLPDPTTILVRSAPAALGLLRHALLGGRSLVLLVDAAEHYAAAVGLLGATVLLVDSADSDVVQFLSDDELLARWDDGGRYWAVRL